MTETRQLLTTKEAATFLGVTETTLRRWRSEGVVKVPYVKIGGRVRYSLPALESYVKAHTVR